MFHDHYRYMRAALEMAHAGYENQEVPVGAIIVHKTYGIIAKAHNLVQERQSEMAHAEILCLRAANKYLQSKRLLDCRLYVTLEPCPMCAEAISLSKIECVIFAAQDPKRGAIINGVRLYSQPSSFHQPKILSGVLAEESSLLLKRFFQEKRKKKC